MQFEGYNEYYETIIPVVLNNDIRNEITKYIGIDFELIEELIKKNHVKVVMIYDNKIKIIDITDIKIYEKYIYISNSKINNDYMWLYSDMLIYRYKNNIEINESALMWDKYTNFAIKIYYKKYDWRFGLINYRKIDKYWNKLDIYDQIIVICIPMFILIFFFLNTFS